MRFGTNIHTHLIPISVLKSTITNMATTQNVEVTSNRRNAEFIVEYLYYNDYNGMGMYRE
jgi:hypothetical protein